MKLFLGLPVLLFACVGCGGRTAMEGAADQECLDGTCEEPGTTMASGGRSGSSSGKSTKGSGVSSSGSKSSGGKPAKGGDGGGPMSSAGQSSGGKPAKGGNGGGPVSSAGQGGTGGIHGMGGTGATSAGGGTMGMAGNTAMISFSNGRANGLMNGWGWVALGYDDSLGSPTCLGQPITAGAPCMTATTWSSPTSLCVQGLIPALPAAPSANDYEMNWGIMVAVESHDPPAPLGQSFSSVLPLVSGTPTFGLRMIVHRMGDAESENYCTHFTPGKDITRDKALSFTSFNTACWDNSGTWLTLADVAKLDWIGIQIPSTATTIRVDLCFGGMWLLPG